MVYKMSEFKSIDQNHISKLREAGIETTDDLMRLWSDKTRRASLETSTGITEEQFADLAAMSRLARVKSVGLQHVEVLVAAGISGPKSLFEYTPEALVKHLDEVIVSKKLTCVGPTLADVGPWFGDRKLETVGAREIAGVSGEAPRSRHSDPSKRLPLPMRPRSSDRGRVPCRG